MITLSDTQLHELLIHLNAIHDILSLHPERPLTVPATSLRVLRKMPKPKLTDATFRYCYWERHPERITLLYQHLIRAKWLAPDTDPDNFCSLFEGNETYVRIKWTGSNLQLAYLIRLLTVRNYITTPKGIGKWTCVYNHFVNKDNRQLPKLNSLHIPKKSKLAISRMAELLNPNT